MTVESATHLNDLNPALPAADDRKQEGDDHIRLMKQVLKTTFPGLSAPINLPIMRPWDLLASNNPVAAGTVDITSGLSAAYDTYMLVYDHLKPVADDVYLFLRVGTGDPVVWQTGAAAYAWGATIVGLAGIAGRGSSLFSLFSSAIALSDESGAGAGVGNALGEHISGHVLFSRPTLADHPIFDFHSRYIRSDGISRGFSGTGNYGAASAITGLRLGFSSGNIASGKVRLYGMKAD